MKVLFGEMEKALTLHPFKQVKNLAASKRTVIVKDPKPKTPKI